MCRRSILATVILKDTQQLGLMFLTSAKLEFAGSAVKFRLFSIQKKLPKPTCPLGNSEWKISVPFSVCASFALIPSLSAFTTMQAKFRASTEMAASSEKLIMERNLP